MTRQIESKSAQPAAESAKQLAGRTLTSRSPAARARRRTPLLASRQPRLELLEERVNMAAYSAGNLLVSSALFGQVPTLYEVTPDGVVVQQTEIPNPTTVVTELPRDVVVDGFGRAQIFNGTFNPRLTTVDPVANTTTSTYMPYWSSSNSQTAGGIAALGNFIFASDQKVGAEQATGQGIVRFNAENLGTGWNTEYDPNIGDSTNNTSTITPHLSIQGTGNGTLDYYSFTVPTNGARGVFDIDGGFTGGAGSFHSQLRILDFSGNVLASSNVFNSPTLGAGGSTSDRDAYLDYTFAKAGQYQIEVGGCCQPSGVPGGANYTLNMSIQGHALTISGGSGVLPETEANDSIYNPQNTDSADRFLSALGETLDVAVGLDGLLYSLLYTGSASGGGRVVNVVDPSTMELVRTITLPTDQRAIAVDKSGSIFAVGGNISHYDQDGVLLNAIANPVGGILGDIDIKANGCRADEPSYPCLAVASNNGYVVITDTSLANFDFFAVRQGLGQNFVAFTAAPLELPSAVDDFYRVSENTSGATFTVMANDLVSSGATLLISNVTTPSAGGSATIVGARSIRYVPARDFSGRETFQYTIDDGRGSTSTGTVTVEVNNINQAPIALPDGYEVEEDSFDQVFSVLDNDTALPDVGEVLTIIAVSTPNQGGTISFDQSQIVYTPKPDFFGLETFNYTISDGNGATATTTVTVTVVDVNDQPTAVADTYAVNPGSFFNQLNVLDNDLIAPDAGETLTIVNVGPTTNGGFVQIDSGTALLYTPPTGSNPNSPYSGPDSFIYQISDGRGGLSSAVVTINVSVVNHPPVASNDFYQIARNSTNNRLDLLVNDTFAPDIGESLSISQFTRPGQGELLQVTQGSTAMLYSPPVGFIGTQTFTYTLSDGRGGTAVGTVTIQVGDFNSQPVSIDDFYTLTQNSVANQLNVLLNDFDPDGTDLITIVNGGQILTASGGIVTVSPDGASLLYSSPQPFLGTDTFDYQITDNRGGFSTGTVTISILGWQNPANPLDVNRDGEVTSLDAVIILNEINRLITPPLTQANGQMPPPVENPIYFYDVNSDGFLTAVDVLQIVNFLNRPGGSGEGEGEGEAEGEGEGEAVVAELGHLSSLVGGAPNLANAGQDYSLSASNAAALATLASPTLTTSLDDHRTALADARLVADRSLVDLDLLAGDWLSANRQGVAAAAPAALDQLLARGFSAAVDTLLADLTP